MKTAILKDRAFLEIQSTGIGLGYIPLDTGINLFEFQISFKAVYGGVDYRVYYSIEHGKDESHE